MDFKGRLTKLQNLPESRKKIILWIIVGVIAVTMGYFWTRGAIKDFSKIGAALGGISMPQIDLSEPANQLKAIKSSLKQTVSPSDLPLTN